MEKRPHFFNFSARIRRKKKAKKAAERQADVVDAGFVDDDGMLRAAKITTKKEALPAKIVLTDASPKNITSLKTFLTERLPRTKVNTFMIFYSKFIKNDHQYKLITVPCS